jgi:hypothetical protein
MIGFLGQYSQIGSEYVEMFQVLLAPFSVR